jgi:hypothetical protein
MLDVECGAGAFWWTPSTGTPRWWRWHATGRRRNLTVLEGDALTVDLPAGGYGAVLSVSALHHLPGVRVRRPVFWRYLLTWTKPELVIGP